MRILCALTISWGLFCAGVVVGQTTQSIDRAQMARDQALTAPAATPGPEEAGELEIVTSPNDPDIGEQQLLRRTERYQPFLASVSIPVYWTSNVALTNSGEQSDILTSPVAAVAYQPRITSNLSAYVGGREQLFYYKRLHDFDFGSLDVDVGLAYTVPQFYRLILRAGYDYNRLTKRKSFDDFFSNHMLVTSAELPIRISRAQQLSIGVSANVSVTATPDGPRRHDFDAYLLYSVQLTRALVVAASGRVSMHEYVLTDRVDVTELVALNVTYAVTEFLSANALASFAANQSNHSIFDYRVGDLGGSASVLIRF
ncbi:MAG TPA: hypothetical protein VJ719_02240 [Chthoniobacterales bacterium]|nr:hypothetical protein [Chthoniobacterales bacterium]